MPFVTNNSLSPTSAYVEKLERLGVKLEPTQMLTASEALSKRLLDVFVAGAAVYVVGAEALHDEIASADLRPVEDHRVADVVGLGWDRDFTYSKLDAICAARWDGVPVGPLWGNDGRLLGGGGPPRNGRVDGAGLWSQLRALAQRRDVAGSCQGFGFETDDRV